jgi:hypothetical protein
MRGRFPFPDRNEMARFLGDFFSGMDNIGEHGNKGMILLTIMAF